MPLLALEIFFLYQQHLLEHDNSVEDNVLYASFRASWLNTRSHHFKRQGGRRTVKSIIIESSSGTRSVHVTLPPSSGSNRNVLPNLMLNCYKQIRRTLKSGAMQG